MAYGRIVVGIDGSPLSREALRWAAEEAELRDCVLEAVYGWQVATEPRPAGDFGAVPPREAYQAAAERRLRAVVEETLPPQRRGRVTVRAVHRPPAKALLECCPGADLVVVGSKGHGVVVTALLGGVATELLRRSPAPVVVIREVLGATADRT